MSDHDILTIERDGNVAILTMNRPEVFNAFNAGLRAAMLAAVREVDSDPAIRIVVLKGAGPGFSAGADLREGLDGSVTRMIEEEYKPFLIAIAESPKLWIASVHGSAAGIGGSLAMTCDLMVMAEDASIYLAFAAIGLIPDGGATWLLLNAFGYRRAFRTIVEGRRIPAAECLEAGIANRLATPDQVHMVALSWAQELAQGAPRAQAAAKRVLRSVGRMSQDEAISLEAQVQQSLVETQDFRDGVAAFFSKRKPVFKGT